MTMTLDETMAALEAAGTAQNRKIYRRHGATDPLFGVSYAVLGKLRKSIKKDHALALGLWATGNLDARVLATMVADASALDDGQLEAWFDDVDNYGLADALTPLAMAMPGRRARGERWIASDDEWRERIGWHVISGLAQTGDLEEDEARTWLARIEEGVHGAKNRVRDSMLGALIGIGSMSDGMASESLAANGRIGPVEVDHGETGCKTPDPAEKVPKMRARLKAREEKAAAAAAK